MRLNTVFPQHLPEGFSILSLHCTVEETEAPGKKKVGNGLGPAGPQGSCSGSPLFQASVGFMHAKIMPFPGWGSQCMWALWPCSPLSGCPASEPQLQAFFSARGPRPTASCHSSDALICFIFTPSWPLHHINFQNRTRKNSTRTPRWLQPHPLGELSLVFLRALGLVSSPACSRPSTLGEFLPHSALLWLSTSRSPQLFLFPCVCRMESWLV